MEYVGIEFQDGRMSDVSPGIGVWERKVTVRSVAWQQIHCDNDPVQIQCTLPVACCSPTFLVISVASAISLHTYIIYLHIYNYICRYIHTSWFLHVKFPELPVRRFFLTDHSVVKCNLASRISANLRSPQNRGESGRMGPDRIVIWCHVNIVCLHMICIHI